MFRCANWIIKKAEHWRIDAFKLWCWRRLLRVPWTSRRSNQSYPKGNQPWIFIGRTDAEAEAPVIWPPDTKSQLIGKTLMLGKIGGRRRRDYRGWDGWKASSTQWTWVCLNSGSWWWTGRPGVLRFMGSQRVRHDWATDLNWTETYPCSWALKMFSILFNYKYECTYLWAFPLI